MEQSKLRQGIVQSLTNLSNDLNEIISNEEYLSRIEELGKIFRSAMDNNYRIFFTGVGKTSFAADKLAATAKSIGLKSEFLNCQDAGHGDIGALPSHKKCFCIYMSKSGKTEEHFKLASLIRERRPNCVNVMVCFATEERAELMKADESHKYCMDKIVNLPMNILESDSFGIVPTNSNALFEACISAAMISAGMCDIYAMFENLKMNHPSGSLHKKVSDWLDSHPME